MLNIYIELSCNFKILFYPEESRVILAEGYREKRCEKKKKDLIAWVRFMLMTASESSVPVPSQNKIPMLSCQRYIHVQYKFGMKSAINMVQVWVL